MAAAQAIINANPAGTTYTLGSGTTRDFGSGGFESGLVFKTNDILEGEGTYASKVLGSALISTWSSIGGGLWEKTGVTQRSASALEARGRDWYAPGTQNREEDLFADGVWLLEVTTEGAVVGGPYVDAAGHTYASGTFFFDRAHVSGGRLVVGFDPAAIEMTLSYRNGFINPGSETGVEVRNLIIGEYVTQVQAGLTGINQTVGTYWHDVEIYGCHGGAVRTSNNCLFEDLNVHDNGQLGIAGTGDNAEISHCRMANNNRAGYDAGWEAGGSKWAVCDGIWVHDCEFIDNQGLGYWTDINVGYSIPTLVEYCYSEGNDRSGFAHEISYEAELRYLVSIRDGLADPRGWGWENGMMIQNSADTWYHHCRVLTGGGGTDGIGMISGSGRGNGPNGLLRIVENALIEDCIIEGWSNGGWYGFMLDDRVDTNTARPRLWQAAANAVMRNNKYYGQANWIGSQRFAANGAGNSQAWAQWLTTGNPTHDIGSSAFNSTPWARERGGAGATGSTVSAVNEENEIVVGGGTLTFTLDDGCWWDSRVGADGPETDALLAHLVSGSGETNGWDAEVVPLLDYTHVTRVDAWTVIITLPAVPSYSLQTTTEDVTLTGPWEALVGPQDATNGDVDFGVLQIVPSVTSGPSVSIGGSILTANEVDIRTGGKEIDFTIVNDTLVTGTTFDDARQTLLDLLVAQSDETNGWNDEALSVLTPGDVTRESATVVRVTLPAIPNYDISVTELIDGAVPGAMLLATSTTVAGEAFAITVFTARALSSTAPAEVLDTTLAAIGLTYTLEVDGDSWVAAGATFDAQRQTIIDAQVAAPGTEASGWPLLLASLAVTDVTRVSDTQVQIAIPAVTGLSLRNPLDVTFNAPASALVSGVALSAVDTMTVKLAEKTAPRIRQRRTGYKFFDIEVAGIIQNQRQSAVLSGTLPPIVLESGIVAGGTIIVDLSGDAFVAVFTAAIQQAVIDGISAASTPPNGWNNTVRDVLATSAVVRNSASRITITVPPTSGYAISSDEQLTVVLPATALLSAAPIIVGTKIDVLNLPDAPVIVPPPTDEEIADALSGRSGPVVQRFRYEWRDHDYVLLGDLSEAVEPGGSIDMDIDRAVAIIGKIEFRPDRLPSGFDVADDHVAISLDVFVNDRFVTFPIALVHMDLSRTVSRPAADGGTLKFVQVDFSDLSVHLQGTTAAPYVIAAGTNYMDAVRAIADIIHTAHNLPTTPDVLPVPMTFGPGTEWREIADTLTSSINYYPVWMNQRGVMTTRKRINPVLEVPVVTYDTTTEPRMILDEIEQEEDRTRFDNQAVVLIDHPARTPRWELRSNDDAASLISTVAEGARLKEIDGPFVVNAARAGDIASWYLRDQAARSDLVELTTLLDPRRSVHGFYRITVGDQIESTLYQALSWRMDMTPGSSMRHTVGRTIDIKLSSESSA